MRVDRRGIELRRVGHDAVLLLILRAPLHALGRDRQRLSGICANDISHTGNTSSRSLPITPTYSSRPSMNCSTMAAVPRLVVDELHAPGELLVVLDDRRLRDAGRRLEEERLDDQREVQPLAAAPACVRAGPP